MAVVIGLWLGYINLTVARVAPPVSEPREVVQKPAAFNEASLAQKGREAHGGPGFFAIFSAGVKIIYDKIAEQLAVKHSIIIENPRKNFIADDVEPIPATKLP